MHRRSIGLWILAVSILPWNTPPRVGRAEYPQEQASPKPDKPGRSVPLDTKPPAIPPPPDESTEGDEGLKPYVFTADQTIELFESHAKARPDDAESFRRLGEAYLRKAKEKGDTDLLGKAESALRRALEIRPGASRAEVALAAVLCDRHRFAEALEIALKLTRNDPSDVSALAILSDAYLELGRYAEARETLTKLQAIAPIPEVLARGAGYDDLTGRNDEAVELMRKALAIVRATSSAKAKAWYQGRLGDLLFDSGKLDEAESAYSAVPEGVDSRHDATFGLGKVLAARGRLIEAIAMVEKAVEIGPDLHMLAFLGDLHALAGNPAKAEEVYRKLEREAPRQAEHGRDFALFLADHDRNPATALELTRKEFAARQDVLTRDALAWALLKNGRADEAAKTIGEALKPGIKNARVFFHAGKIHQALGNQDLARRYFEQALALNPHFSPTQSREARKALGDGTKP